MLKIVKLNCICDDGYSKITSIQLSLYPVCVRLSSKSNESQCSEPNKCQICCTNANINNVVAAPPGKNAQFNSIPCGFPIGSIQISSNLFSFRQSNASIKPNPDALKFKSTLYLFSY